MLEDMTIFAPTIARGYGEIGRHARLRIWCRKACRFESYYPHQKSFSVEKLFFVLYYYLELTKL